MAERESRPPARDRGQPPVVKDARAVSLVPRVAHVPGALFVPPGSLVAAAEEMEREMRSRIRAEMAEEEMPTEGEIRDRVLQLTRNIPPGDQQQIVLTVRDRPPYFSATTRRVRG